MPSISLIDKLTTHLKNTLARAISLAAMTHAKGVSPFHLFVALGSEQGSVGGEILTKVGFQKNELFTMLTHENYSGAPLEGSEQSIANLPELDPQAKQVLEKAMRAAFEHEHAYVGTEHLLYGLIEIGNPQIVALLVSKGIKEEDIFDQIATVFHSTNRFPHVDDVADAVSQMKDMGAGMIHMQSGDKQPAGKGKERGRAPSHALDAFTVNLTSKEMRKKIDHVIGRENEIDRLINILGRRHKNNPLLIGEPGVGKTAIVEGLAKRIAEGTVPSSLREKKILSLDLTLLIAGTIYRGEFEARLKQVLDELKDRPNVILFIDEIHNIIGAGSNQGTMDAANIMKPALARGDLRCIGATTIDEYKKYFSSDPALERRFQPITVEEPSAEETYEILLGLRESYEEFHHTTITEDAVQAAITLSTKFVHDNRLPDKAIDLIDEAAAAVKNRQQTPPSLEATRERLLDEIEESRKEKEDAIIAEDFERALALKDEIANMEIELKHLAHTQAEKPVAARRKKVTAEDIAEVIARRLTIDPQKLLTDPILDLVRVKDELTERIVGQNEVIETIIQELQKAYLPLSKKKRPLASLLFAGPSGVGKTQLAKELAMALYLDEKALIRLDMSEFSEGHGVSKLLGSPAGYVGFKERNRFFEQLQKRPHSVVLFDEIDKAHPDVIRLLLQILDSGELTDSMGKKLSFTNTIVILTTNIGATRYRSHGVGFTEAHERTDKTVKTETKHAIQDDLKETFSIALLDRLSAVCLFRMLSHEDMEKIIKRQVNELSQSLQAVTKISLSVDTPALEKLITLGSSEESGARNIEQTVERVIGELLPPLLSKAAPKHKYRLSFSSKFILK